MKTRNDFEVLVSTPMGDIPVNFIYQEDDNTLYLGEKTIQMERLINYDIAQFDIYNNKPHSHVFRKIDLGSIVLASISIEGELIRCFYKYGEDGKCCGAIGRCVLNDYEGKEGNYLALKVAECCKM